MKTTRIFSSIIVVCLLCVHFSGCEQEDLDFYIDCDFCLDVIPEKDTIWIYFTIDDENPFVPFEYHEGDFEDGAYILKDTAWTESVGIESMINQKYSVKATYTQNGKPVVAIDGDKMQIVDGEEDCSPPCYYIRGGTVDVRLK